MKQVLAHLPRTRLNPGSTLDAPDAVGLERAGQIVGRTNEIRPVEQIMAELVSEYEETVARLEKIRG